MKQMKFGVVLIVVSLALGLVLPPAAVAGDPQLRLQLPQNTPQSIFYEIGSPMGVASDGGGYTYVAVAGGAIWEFDPNGNFVRQWTVSGPIGVAVDGSVNVYVADTVNNCIQKFDSAGNPLGQFGSGKFKNPCGVAVDGSGNVFVTDTGYNCIWRYDAKTTQLTQWGGLGNGNGTFNNPTGVAVDANGHVYVLDRNNYLIQKFDNAGTFLTQWGGQGDLGHGTFQSPQGVAVDDQGHVFVTDVWYDPIQEFDSSGNFLNQWSSGNMWDIRGVTLDSFGNFYVADAGYHRIWKFDSGSSLVKSWGMYGPENGWFCGVSGIVADGQGNFFVADNGNGRIQKFDASGHWLANWSTDAGPFAFQPVGLALDAQGNLYATDGESPFSMPGNCKIRKFDASGALVATYGNGYGHGDGQFWGPQGLALDSQGNVYVADSYNNRIQKFDSKGNFVAAWDQISRPNAVAVDRQNNIYVTETLGYQIQKFDPSGNLITAWSSPFYSQPDFMTGGMACDAQGNIWVSTPSLDVEIPTRSGYIWKTLSFWKFSSSGALLGTWDLGDNTPGSLAACRGNLYGTHADYGVVVFGGLPGPALPFLNLLLSD